MAFNPWRRASAIACGFGRRENRFLISLMYVTQQGVSCKCSRTLRKLSSQPARQAAIRHTGMEHKTMWRYHVQVHSSLDEWMDSTRRRHVQDGHHHCHHLLLLPSTSAESVQDRGGFGDLKPVSRSVPSLGPLLRRNPKCGLILDSKRYHMALTCQGISHRVIYTSKLHISVLDPAGGLQ